MPNRSYRLGPKLLRIAEAATDQWIALAEPLVSSVALQLGETTSLVRLENDMLVYALQVPSQHTLRAAVDVGQALPAQDSGTGKVLLAQLRDEQLTAHISAPGTSARRRAAVQSAIHQIRLDKFCIEDDGWGPGTRTFTVPIAGIFQPLALSVVGPIARFSDRPKDSTLAVLHRAASQIRNQLAETLNS